MTTRIVTVGVDGITVARLAWDLYRSTQSDLVERIFALNPGLGRADISLSPGLKLKVDGEPLAQFGTRGVIRLWD